MESSVGQQVENARNQRGLTRSELAEATGLSYKLIWKIEKGGSTTMLSLWKIVDALGTPLVISPTESAT